MDLQGQGGTEVAMISLMYNHRRWIRQSAAVAAADATEGFILCKLKLGNRFGVQGSCSRAAGLLPRIISRGSRVGSRGFVAITRILLVVFLFFCLFYLAPTTRYTSLRRNLLIFSFSMQSVPNSFFFLVAQLSQRGGLGSLVRR